MVNQGCIGMGRKRKSVQLCKFETRQNLPPVLNMQGRIQDFQKGGGHTLIERAISYHFSQKGYHVRACTTGTRGHPRCAVPGTVWGRDYIE